MHFASAALILPWFALLHGLVGDFGLHRQRAMSAARQGWLQAALGAAAGAAAAALLLRRRKRSNLQASEELDSADDPLRRFRKTEAVIRRRNSRVVVVIERCNESHNCAAQSHFL